MEWMVYVGNPMTKFFIVTLAVRFIVLQGANAFQETLESNFVSQRGT